LGRGLIVLHLDGLGFDLLRRALDAGLMPAVAALIREERYEPLAYRSGIPSTTPFCQAGILYGDNSEIPSYRWWDKDAGMLVAFGAGSGFKKVAHHYFEGARPLTEGGAVIGACYPAGAKDTFGLAYRERSGSAARVIGPFFSNPLRVGAWLRHGGWAVGRTGIAALRDRAARRPAAPAYVASDMLEEIFLHHVSRFAVLQAMDHDFPTIYAGFYAYDETAHAFGPEDPYCFEMLKHVDRTVGEIAARRRGRRGSPSDYELVILSDHGQVETEPFSHRDGRSLGELIAARLPTYEVEEFKGGHYRPASKAVDGRVALTYSGGLANLYFTERPGRLRLEDLDSDLPGLADAIASLGRVAFVLAAGNPEDGWLINGEGRMPLRGKDANALLARYDDPAVLTAQLARLNSFRRSGDLVIFGAFRGGRQINFEHQVGGHGSIGGEQVKPFLLAKQEWGLDLSGVTNAADLHPILSDLRDRVAGAA